MSRELTQFLAAWEQEAARSQRLLESLPADQYDFRPDPKGRSLGELAWHLAEIDGFIADGVAKGAFDFNAKLAGLERPRTIAALAPGYRVVHRDAVAKIAALEPGELDRSIEFMGPPVRAGQLLWDALLHHAIHHRGQLVLMVRLAGGVPPGLFGPTREDMAAARGN